MFVDFFIRRPIFATVCSLIIILAGAICIPPLPIAQYPELAPPQVRVTAVYIGASAQARRERGHDPARAGDQRRRGHALHQSSSSNNGVSHDQRHFEVDRDIDLAAVDVQNRVNQVPRRLPAEVRNTGVIVTKNTAGFLGGLGFYSDDNRYNSQFISNYVDVYVRDALKRIPGVGEVRIFGERKFAMRLWLDRTGSRRASSPPATCRGAAGAEPAGRRRAGRRRARRTPGRPTS